MTLQDPGPDPVFTEGDRVKMLGLGPDGQATRSGTVVSVDRHLPYLNRSYLQNYIYVRWDDGRGGSYWVRDRSIIKQDLISAVGELEPQ